MGLQLERGTGRPGPAGAAVAGLLGGSLSACASLQPTDDISTCFLCRAESRPGWDSSPPQGPAQVVRVPSGGLDLDISASGQPPAAAGSNVRGAGGFFGGALSRGDKTGSAALLRQPLLCSPLRNVGGADLHRPTPLGSAH